MMANGPNDGLTTTHQHQESKFFYADYLRSKQQLKAKNEKSHKFCNSIKIVSSVFVISSRSLFLALKDLINNDVKHVTSIAQYKDSRTFIITFNEVLKASELIGKSLLISEQSLTILDPNTSKDDEITLTSTFRVHWLPTDLNLKRKGL